MGLTQEQLIEHCRKIIKHPRIKNKIVVLCEGEGGIWDTSVRESPAIYARMEQMPDANFYKKCVPKSWSQYRPEFFNCGDRKDVIDTYFKILDLHDSDSNNSYLNPNKLFAIVDLDLQETKIQNYSFTNTEAIFCHLYQQARVNEENASEHRIWVTGLIHKESYFIIPELQEIFDKSRNIPLYNDIHLSLNKIYIDMAESIVNDSDLQSNLQKVSNRISYCTRLDCTGIEQLQNSWKEEFQNAEDDFQKNQLIFALLTFKKAKDYWKKIQPPSDWTNTHQAFLDEKLLEIANFYSSQTDYSKYHIPAFMQFLKCKLS